MLSFMKLQIFELFPAVYNIITLNGDDFAYGSKHIKQHSLPVNPTAWSGTSWSHSESKMPPLTLQQKPLFADECAPRAGHNEPGSQIDLALWAKKKFNLANVLHQANNSLLLKSSFNNATKQPKTLFKSIRPPTAPVLEKTPFQWICAQKILVIKSLDR